MRPETKKKQHVVPSLADIFPLLNYCRYEVGLAKRAGGAHRCNYRRPSARNCPQDDLCSAWELTYGAANTEAF